MNLVLFLTPTALDIVAHIAQIVTTHSAALN